MESALFTDLYELSMAQAYVADGVDGDAEFEIFFRDLGPRRGYLLACGIEAVLEWLATCRLSSREIAYLDSLGAFTPEFLEWLSAAEFGGDIHAVPEGTAIFPNEPLLRIRAPLPVAQLLETRVLNAVHYASLVTTKASRIVDAAGERGVVDFGARRAHGVDAAFTAARATWIAGGGGSSNMVAGHRLGIPVVGTMAHSFVQSHPDELSAFRVFTAHYPETTLLVDTYDTIEGVRNVVRLAEEQGPQFRVRAIRLDSGDLDDLSRQARTMLDEAGLSQMRILASGGLDERRIAGLIERGAPIDGFGVGTDLVVSSDVPTIDFAYKLVTYQGQPRLKGSTGKGTLPGAKQVYRTMRGGVMTGDTIARADERVDGEPLLRPVVQSGERIEPAEALAAVRERVQQQRQALPANLRQPEPAPPGYPVSISDGLAADRDRILQAHSAFVAQQA
jgi:nicotinate phosphoribosyltransferase